jgi:2-keto-4-pentenoate hydratase/2-oxohepta-3-ene-1,7-dioic acid hydratase in catechol pathway
VRLVTYDRRGHRRLGAFLGDEVVDLPELVGHPAFPVSMEALVSSRRGSVLDAARAALERDEAAGLVIPHAVVLPPLLPSSLRSEDAWDGVRTMVGPGEVIPWPSGAGWLDYEPKVAAVLGGPARRLSTGEAERAIFGYTLVNDWIARDANGNPAAIAEGVPVAIGPCIVTAEEVDPQAMFVTVRVNGEEWAKGNLNGAARNLAVTISRASKVEALRAADAFAESPFEGFGPDPSRQLWPGVVVELEAEGIGVLRNRLGPRV